MIDLTKEFLIAQQYYKAGDYRNAGANCSNILKVNQNHPEGLLLLGMILNKIKNYKAALQFLEKAAIFHPSKFAILTEKAIANMGLYQFQEAEKLLDESLKINSNYEKSHIQLAICMKLIKEPERSEVILKNWLKIKPNSVSALNNLANLFTEQNKMEEAEPYYLKSLKVDPKNVKAIINLGYFNLIKGNVETAEEFINKGVQITPNDPFAISKLALLTAQKGQTDQALEILDSAIKRNIADQEILNTFGTIFIQTGELTKAKNAFLESLKIKPNHAETLLLLGRIYNELSLFSKASEVLTKALELNPWNESPKFDLAYTFQFLNKEEEAYLLMREMYEKHPDDDNIFFTFVRMLCDMCEWDNRKEVEEKFIRAVERLVEINKEFPFKVFNFNYFNIPIDLQLEASKSLARFFNKQVGSIKKRVSFSYNWPKHERIRIGYISPDFRSHPIGQVIYHLFQYHNRSQFEVYAYALLVQNNSEDVFRDKIIADVDHFINIQRMGFEESAKQINSDEIDILIDLAGYTTYSRTPILALRPSPVQVLFMGQPDSSGADFIDYYIADKILVPEENQKYYTEKIIYLPTGYFGSPLKISDKKYKKSDFGISEDAFVFCCFCNPYKYEPVLFAAWMEILKRTPNGVLWLNPAKCDRYKNNILKNTAKHGVEPSRIFFAERLPHEEYMARYRVCDLFLDTLHYSAGSTAISALMAGVPVITTTGVRNAENMGASICYAANLPNTICSSVNEYIDKAVGLAENPMKLVELKTRLKEEYDKQPLFDVKQFVSDLETELKLIVD
jgi:predicted O-linked N-acetylglucosamine transferase (SPINDLY family)